MDVCMSVNAYSDEYVSSIRQLGVDENTVGEILVDDFNM